MDKLLSDSSSLLAIGGFILGVFSLLFALYSYNNRHPSKKRLCYSIRSHTIIKKFPNVDKLSLKYNEKTIDAVTITFLAIWNNGKSTIYPSDFLKGAPLSVYAVDKSEILKMEIVYYSNKLSEFKINSTGNNRFKMTFNYLEKNEGVILKIVHTGSSSKSITVNCHIKGDKKPSQINFTDYYTVLSRDRNSSGIIYTIALLFGIIGGFGCFYFLNTYISSVFFCVLIAVFIGFSLSAIVSSFIVRLLSKHPRANWIPLDEFNIYEEIYKK